MTQETLWDAAGVIRINTRAAVAAAIASLRPGLRRQVFEFVVSQGERGATDYEIHLAVRMAKDTSRVRRVELVKAGILVASGRTRPSPTGCPMNVWIATGKPLD